MPPPFVRLSVDEFARMLERFPLRRQIVGVHMHHTWRPNHAQFKGYESIVAMWRYHTKERGFADIAQHLTIAPNGDLWTGRDWNRPPASAVGYNGNATHGPFMFEIVGDFDRGRDPFAGEQRRAVLDVVKLLLQRFKLSPESVLFHNQMSGKSCPGSTIDRTAFLAEVASHTLPVASTSGRSGARLFSAGALKLDAVVGEAIESMRRDSGVTPGVTLGDECPYDEDATADVGSRGGSSADVGDDDDLRSVLRPHLVNLRLGRFSDSGRWTTTEGDVEAIFQEDLPRWIESRTDPAQPARLVFYAHGGLVSESSGLAIARNQCSWWRRNNVYPIFFVWETGLFETIGQILERIRTRGGDAGERGFVTDYLTDPLVEEAVRAFQTPRIWGGMKAAARAASAAGGGAAYVAELLSGLVQAFPGEVELHAVGHSAGSIFLSHFVDLCVREGGTRFETLQLLAPAMTCAEFYARVVPHTGKTPGIGHVTNFTMRRTFEEADSCAGIYRKSLLYLVSEACEAERKTPILGLEKSLRADREVKRFFGLAGDPSPLGEVVWSKSASHTGRHASQAMSHGGFDEDAATMESVLRRVLGVDDDTTIQPFSSKAGQRGLTDWLAQVDLPEWLRRSPAVANVAPAALITGNATTNQELSAGARKAVCIGINAYAESPLAACVADAQLWERTLRDLRFETRLLVDAEATYERILAELGELIGSARAGDTLVFQFAGHGTYVDDVDGDEAKGDTPGQDEALVPVDYRNGGLILDDEIAAAVAKLPPGVRLTFLLDCCHSGTASRFAMSSVPATLPGGQVRTRWLPLSPEVRAAHVRFRQQHAGTRATRASDAGVASMREVTFAACQSHEVARERDGHGDFTRFAHQVLQQAPNRLSNAAFHELVLRAFGSGAAQRPHLDCDVALRDAPFLGIALR